MKMSHLLLAGALLAPTGFSQTPADELKSLEAGYAAADGTSAAKYLEFAPRFEAFAEAHVGTDFGLDARLWQLSQSWWLRKDGTMHDRARIAAAAILDEYPDSGRLGMMAEASYVFSPADRAFFLGKLRESRHREVGAAATYQLASRAKGDERTEFFRSLANEYGAVKKGFGTYGEIADAALHPHSPDALEIGEVAPDIVGRDVDGVEMKLSDYRGKVVVVDFWGDW